MKKKLTCVIAEGLIGSVAVVNHPSGGEGLSSLVPQRERGWETVGEDKIIKSVSSCELYELLPVWCP